MIAIVAAALLLVLALHLGLPSEISLGTALSLAAGAEPDGWGEVLFVHSAAPRAAMAMLVGAAFGLAGASSSRRH